MGSEFGYQFSNKANDDADEIITRLKSKYFDLAAASNFVESMLKTLQTLVLFPESGGTCQK